MAQFFTFTANIPVGNGVSLLANSTVTFANGATVVNGNTTVYFDEVLNITSPAAGNLALVPGANSTIAANVTFARGQAMLDGAAITIPPAVPLKANATLNRATANLVFLAGSGAAQTITGSGW